MHPNTAVPPLARIIRLALVTCALIAAAGCQVKPAQMYRPGYDHMLTAEAWAARSPEDAVVIISGTTAQWDNVDVPGFGFENRPRLEVDWRTSYDVALVKPGQYQLRNILLDNFYAVDFAAISGLGQKATSKYATFTVKPGEIVYVGEFTVQSGQAAPGLCIASLFVRDNLAAVQAKLPTQVPYIAGKPIATSLVRIEENNIRFPAPCN